MLIRRHLPKDVYEQSVLDRLLGHLALELDRPPEKSEEPDFLLQMNGRRIGVEVTRLFKPIGDGDDGNPGSVIGPPNPSQPGASGDPC